MRNFRRLTAAALVLGTVAALAAFLARPSTPAQSAAAKARVAQLAHATLHERDQGGDGGAEAQAYQDRAFPASEVTIAEIQGAIRADAKLKTKGPKLFSKWDSIGPDTLDVDRLGTQAFNKGTQWSGRITALTIDPNCTADDCTLYVGAAGGGVWRTKNALAPTPAWKQISEGIPTNA